MNPLVSVIVPVYNVYPYLREALDSVTGQTYKDLEIILIDDGSTDGSGEICDEYASRDNRVLVIHQENKGLSAARNAGLDSSSGDVFAFFDPDDSLRSDFVEKTLAALMGEDADMVLCRYSAQHTTEHLSDSSCDKTMPSIKPGLYDRDAVLEALIGHKMNVSIWNKLYKKHLWDSVRFCEGHVFEDTDATYKICSRIEKLCVIPEVLYLHRKHKDSITSSTSRTILEDAVQSYIRTEPFIRANVLDVFSDDQLFLFDRLLVKQMLHIFNRSKSIAGDSGHEFRSGLRKQIAESGERYGVKRFGFSINTAYLMVCRCPWMFDVCYPAAVFLRRAFKKITGR